MGLTKDAEVVELTEGNVRELHRRIEELEIVTKVYHKVLVQMVCLLSLPIGSIHARHMLKKLGVEEEEK